MADNFKDFYLLTLKEDLTGGGRMVVVVAVVVVVVGEGGQVLIHKDFFDGDARPSTNFNYQKNRMTKNSNPL